MENDEKFIKNDDGTITVPLQTPVTAEKKVNGEVQEEKFTEIKFRQFSFGDFNALANKNFKNDNQEAYFLVKLLAIRFPSDAFDKICGADMETCMEAVQSFLPKSQET
ncbi:MAG: phage tail assembly protein [Gammaproteobacteria bacterium]|nr:phage tail assembly protein [Gammaproteobacteria bacterium]